MRPILGLFAISLAVSLTASLTGCGSSSGPASAPAAILSATSLTFANTLVGSTSTLQVTLSNGGNAALSIALTPTSPFTIATTAQGSCGTTLAAGSSCTISVVFTPAAATAYTGSLSIADNAAGSPQTVTLTGLGVVPVATLSTTSLAFPNTLAGTMASNLTVTLTNTGMGPMVVSSIASNNTIFPETNNCGILPVTLAPGGMCTIAVGFNPTIAGTFSATLTIADSAAGSPQMVAITGTGTVPIATFSPTSIAFPNTAVGSSAAALSTTLTNTGLGLMTISNIQIIGLGASNFTITTDGCDMSGTFPTTLQPSVACMVSVTFTPTAATIYNATLSFTDTAAGSSQSVALTGTGVVSVASLSPSSLSFPATPVNVASSALTTTLYNTGGAVMNITGITVTGAFARPTGTAGGTCPTGAGTLPALTGSCTISVTFTPTSVTGFNGTISVNDNAAGTPQMVALSGSSTLPVAALCTGPISFPFTDIATTSSPLTCTISNTGTSPLTISAFTFTGINAANFAVSSTTCGALPATVAANTGTCTILVTFTPPAAGTFTAALSVTDNSTNSPQSVAVTGTAATPALTVSPASLAFTTTDVSSASSAMLVTVTSTGNGPVIFSSFGMGGTNPGNFAVTPNTCSISTPLAVGNSCTLNVTFTPAAVASYMANLNINDNVSGSPQMVGLTGSGGVPAVSISPTSLNFLTNLVGSTETFAATLTNIGSGPLTITNVKSSGSAAFTVGSGSCNGIIAAGATCPITVTYSPTAAGPVSATVTVNDNVSTTQTVLNTGTGVAVEPNSCKTVNTTTPAQPTPTANYAGTAFTGTVLSATTPVIGASVQLYAAGLTGNGSAPTALGSALTTSSTGAFTVPNTYTCPYSNSVLYAVAKGGKVGSTGVTNAAIELAGVVGVCNRIATGSNVVINELTTAVTAWTMSPFLAAGGKIGSSSTNGSGIVLAEGSYTNLVNIGAGTTPGLYFPNTGVAPTARINQVADLLNGCVASSTGASSVGCTQLFTLTSTSTLTPANTLDAVMNMVKNPGNNVAALYTQSSASVAYAPVLAAAPNDWTLFVNYTGGGMSDPSAVAVDSVGRVWVANYFNVASLFSNTGTPVFTTGITGNYLENSYGGTTDVNDVMWIANEESSGVNGGLGTITLLNNGGTANAVYSAGGLNFPIAISFDTSGLAWIVDYGNSQLTVLNGAGAPQSGASGYASYQFEFPVAVATDAKCNAFTANQSSNNVTFSSADGTIQGSYIVGSGPSGIAVDGTGNVWTANYYGNSVGELNPGSGAILSGVNGYTGGGVNHPQGIAVDGAGNIWVANYRTNSTTGNAISELAGSTAATPGAALSPAAGLGTDAGLVEAFGIAPDAAGNLWITSFGSNVLTEFIGIAAPVKTPLLGPVRVP